MQDDLWDYLGKRLSGSIQRALVSPVPSVISGTLLKIGGSASISSDTEMRQFLDAVLENVIRDYCPDFRTLAGPVGHNYKWRYSSAYQKAVRRNDPSVTAVAVALNNCDPAYIWRRAPTIALEDVGLGDPWVCALVLHACRFSKLRARHGLDKLGAFLGELMGSAVKDRLSCDSYCLPYFHPELAEVRAAVDDMSADERADLYRSDHTPFGSRVAAGISLAGPRYGGDVFSGSGGSPDQLAEAVEGLVPYPIQWLSRQYAKMARDGMFVSLPLVWRQLISEGQTQLVQGDVPKRSLIEGVLAATFDGHTQEGRRALAYFGKACAPIRKVIGDVANQNKLIALAVFTVDSTLLDRYLSSPWATELYKENLRGEVLAAGFSMGQFYDLAEAVAHNRDDLHHARMRVMR